MKHSLRIEIATALFVVFGLLSSVAGVHEAARLPQKLRARTDFVTKFGERIASIRAELPSSGIVGFVSEPPEDHWTNPVYTREIVLARYFMSPLLVLPYEHQSLVIGSFHGTPPNQLLQDWGLTVVKDYGDGVMLLARRAR